MAELGTAVIRVIPDMNGLNARVAGYFSSSQWSRMGKTAGAALGAGLVAGGAVKGLYEIGQAFDDANDKIRVGTGKTGKALKGLENDFKAVAKRTASDFGTTADAITDLNRRLGLTGKPLRRLSKQFLDLSRMTGTDLGGNIDTVARAFKDWEVGTRRQSKVLDGFFRLGQKTGITVDEIASSVQRFGSPLRQLGFSLGEAASLFANFERAGVNTQTMVPGLKLAIANLTQPTADLAGTMDKLGIAAGKPEKGLRQVLSILGDESRGKVERISLAMDVFGKRAGSDMKEAIEQGRFSVDKLLQTFRDDNGDSISKAAKATEDFSEHWQKFKNNVMVGLEPLSRRVFQGISKEAKEMFKILNDPKLSLDEKLEKVFGRAMERIGEIAPKLAKAFFRAWWNAGVWAKLATFGFVAWKLGLLQKMATGLATRFAAWFAATAGTRMAAALAADGLIGSKFGKAGKWTSMGRGAGKLFGRGLVYGIVAGIALYGEQIGDALRNEVQKRVNPGGGHTSLPGPQNDPGSSISENFIGIDLGFRKGGKVPRFAGGGMVPSLVSSGELLAFPDGSTVQVPGARVAADNVLTSLPVGTAVFTGHGQQLLAGGASPTEALTRQMPHFASGGTVARAAKAAGFRGSALVRMVAEAGAESTWNERAVGDGGDSRGLWQINLPSHAWARRMRLFDPFVNARAAYRVYREAGNSFGPWHADHTPWIGRAQRAVASIQGMSVGGSRTVFGRASGGDPSAFRDAVSGAFTAGREGRSLRGVQRAIFGAVRAGAKRPERSTGGGFTGGGVPGGLFRRSGVPSNLLRMGAKAAWISRQHYGYKWGGGHNAAMTGPYDCSGAVSAVLASGGYGGLPRTSGGLMSWGQPGKGRYVTLYTGPSHVFMRIGTKYFGTSGQNPGGGANWMPRFPGMPAGGVYRHPKGLRRGGMVGLSRLPKKLRENPFIIDEFERTGLLPGLRRGGTIGWPNIGRSFIGSIQGASGAGEGQLRQYAQALNSLTLGQIHRHLKTWADALKKADGAAAARIRGAAALASAELAHRAGRLARQSDKLGRTLERDQLQGRLYQAAFGIDPNSAAGMDIAVTGLKMDRKVMEQRRRKLARALKLAQAAGDRVAAKQLREEIGELDTSITETTISIIDGRREQVEQLAAEYTAGLQKRFDVAGAFRSIGDTMLQGLELDQTLAGTFDTPEARKARSDFIRNTVIPFVQWQMNALKPLFVDALNRGDTLGALDIWNQYFGLGNEIKQLTIDSNELLKPIVDNTADTAAATERLVEQLRQQVELLKDQLRDANLKYAVSQAQYAVFNGMPHFADGGVVPGPRGAPRMVVAHGGETITPAGEAPILVNVIVKDGAVDGRRIEAVAERVIGKQVGRGMRPLAGRGGGLVG